MHQISCGLMLDATVTQSWVSGDTSAKARLLILLFIQKANSFLNLEICSLYYNAGVIHL